MEGSFVRIKAGIMENFQLQFISQASLHKAYILAALVIAVWFIAPGFGRKADTVVSGAAVAGARSRWEPMLITRYRFPFGGWPVVYQGYKKFKEDIFTIVRPESAVTVLPKRYIKELQNIPDTRLNPIAAIARDLMGDYTGINVLLGSHLGFNAVQKRLNPQIPFFNHVLQEELDYAMMNDFPYVGDAWVDVDLNEVILKVVSRLTARIFVGFPLCRNEKWLSINAGIVEELFKTMFVLRLFPPMFHPIVSVLLPFQWRLWSYLRQIHSLLIPMIEQRRDSGKEELGIYEKPQDIIQWMMDLANEQESDPANLASRYVYTILGSIHTVRGAIIDTLYDICAHQDEYLQPLRIEMEQAIRDDGGWGQSTAAKMTKMDSFMKETQRLNPPSALGFKRILREPITLSDGTKLPKDAYICVVTESHLQDEIAAPGKFDGFRYFKKALEPGARASRLQYSSTDDNHIHFGHGRYACPGRFVASLEIKMVLARLLLHYDMTFPAGQGRPVNLTVLELSFQDPKGRLMLRKRS